MNQQQKNFMNIITLYASVSNYNDCNPILEDPDWNELYNLAYIHSLSGMFYTVVERLNLCSDEALMNNMAKSFMNTVSNSVNQEMALSTVLELLNDNGIRHIIFKGTVLREYYPDKELRTMGDIDLVIDKADKERTHRILLDAGASYDEIDSHADVANYQLHGVVFEIHTSVISGNLFDDVNCVGYFGNLFCHAELREACTYELKKEFHLIYLLAHMAKHFKFGGCGLRMYMDIVMFLRHFDGALDWNYIRIELQKLGFIDFADSVFQFCDIWFGTDIALSEKVISEDEMDVITEYVLAGGTFGCHNKNIDAIRAGNQKNNWLSKLRTVGCFLFPSYAHLKRRYVWMKDTPKWLLPISWVRYWYYRIFVIKQANLKRIKLAVGSNEDALKHYQLMEKVGLLQKE